MVFKNAIVLGNGQLASVCAATMQKTGIPVKVFDTSAEKSPYLERLSQKQGTPYFHVQKKELFDFLKNANLKTLLISAVNPIIIPASVLSNQQITAINLHHALLPRHPGRNAEAWAIYEQDSETGVTWHFMTPEVDAGQVLIQRRFALDHKITAIKLLKYLHDLAVDSFFEIISDLLRDREISYPQPQESKGKMHYSWEIPNQGYVDLNWTAQKISAFLRSMDYGILETLGKPKLQINEKCYIWKKYEIEEIPRGNVIEEVRMFDSSVTIIKNNHRINLLNISQIE